MTIHFFSGENRTINVDVNGVSIGTLTRWNCNKKTTSGGTDREK